MEDYKDDIIIAECQWSVILMFTHERIAIGAFLCYKVT